MAHKISKTLCFMVLLLLLHSLLFGQNWTRWRGSNQTDGYVNTTLPGNPLCVLWENDLGVLGLYKDLKNLIAINNSNYTGSPRRLYRFINSHLMCVNQDNGATIWDQDLSGTLAIVPNGLRQPKLVARIDSLNNTDIYITLIDDTVNLSYIYRIVDLGSNIQSPIIQTALSYDIVNTPLIIENQGVNNGLYFYHVGSGVITRINLDTLGPTANSPFLGLYGEYGPNNENSFSSSNDNKILFFGSYTSPGRLCAVTVDFAHWDSSFTLPYPIYSNITVHGNYLYFLTSDSVGHLSSTLHKVQYSFNGTSFSFTEVWATPYYDGAEMGDISIKETTTGELYLYLTDLWGVGGFRIIRDLGTSAIPIPIAAGISAGVYNQLPVTVSNDKIYVKSSDGNLYSMNLNGSNMHIYKFREGWGDWEGSSPIICDNKIFVQFKESTSGANGKLVALGECELKDKGIDWLHTMQILSPGLPEDGAWGFYNESIPQPSWAEMRDVAITSLSVLSLLNEGKYRFADPAFPYPPSGPPYHWTYGLALDDPAVQLGMNYILRNRRLTYTYPGGEKEGPISDWDKLIERPSTNVYDTGAASAALSGYRRLSRTFNRWLSDPKNPDIEDAMKMGWRYLMNNQQIEYDSTENLVNIATQRTHKIASCASPNDTPRIYDPNIYYPTDCQYGGWGYPFACLQPGWADMSNSQFAIWGLEVLDTETRNTTGPSWSVPDTNSLPLSGNIQLLFYPERQIKAYGFIKNSAVDPSLSGPTGGLYAACSDVRNLQNGPNPYGSITAASIWAAYCVNAPFGGGLPLADREIQWFQSLPLNTLYGSSINPGMGSPQKWYYYYVMSMTKAMLMNGILTTAGSLPGILDWYTPTINHLSGIALTTTKPSWYGTAYNVNYWNNSGDVEEPDVFASISSILSIETKHLPVSYYGGSKLHIEILSPAELLVTDPLNNKTGCENGSTIVQIPASTFNDCSAHPQIVEVINPAGTYLIDLKGTGTGPVTIRVWTTYDGNIVSQYDKTINISTGETIEFKASVGNVLWPMTLSCDFAKLNIAYPTPTAATYTPTPMPHATVIVTYTANYPIWNSSAVMPTPVIVQPQVNRGNGYETFNAQFIFATPFTNPINFYIYRCATCPPFVLDGVPAPSRTGPSGYFSYNANSITFTVNTVTNPAYINISNLFFQRYDLPVTTPGIYEYPVYIAPNFTQTPQPYYVNLILMIPTQTNTATISPTTTITSTITPTPTVTETAVDTLTETSTETDTPEATATDTMPETATATPGCGEARINSPKVNMQVNINSLSVQSQNFAVKIFNYESTALNLSNFSIKVWLYESSAENMHTFNNGTGWTHAPGQSDVNANNFQGTITRGDIAASCLTDPTHEANQYVIFNFAGNIQIPANGGYFYTQGDTLKFGRNNPDMDNNNWNDDYSVASTGSWIDSPYYALYYNNTLVYESTDSSGSVDVNTGVPPCDNACTATYSITPTITLTHTITPTYSTTATFIDTITLTNTPVNTSTVTQSITQTITPTSSNTKTVTPSVTPSSTTTASPTSTQTVTKTFTPSYTATKTITATFTQQPTLTYTVTSAPTLTPTQGTSTLSLKFKAATIGQYTNSPHPQFRVYNNGSSSIALSRIEIRYWYKFEGTNQSEQTWLDDARRLPSGTYIGSYVNLAILSGNFGGSQDRYLKVTFASGAGNIGQNEYAEIQTRFNKSDWSNYDQNNDYSYINYSTFTDWTKVGVYLDGNLVWGNAPLGLLSIKNEPTPNLEFTAVNVYNYPNPSSGRTTIRFPLTEPQDVQISIYDLNGKKVWNKTLAALETSRGINSIIWDAVNDDGTEAANGVYILKVQVGKQSITKKIAIVR